MVALNIETFVVSLVIAFLAGILVAKIKLKKLRRNIMGFTLFGEEYKYEVDSINIGIFCPDGTLLIVLKLKDGTYKSIDVNLGAEKYKSLCKENDITNNVPVLVTQEHVNKLD